MIFEDVKESSGNVRSIIHTWMDSNRTGEKKEKIAAFNVLMRLHVPKKFYGIALYFSQQSAKS